MENSIEVKPQGLKRFAKGPLKLALVAINKLSNPMYKKLHPRYLSWLGINLSKDFSSYGDPWISPERRFDAAGYNLITLGDGVTISYGTSILVHDFSIDKTLFARRKRHGKFIKPVSIGRNCFIGANAMILPGTTIGNNCIIWGVYRQRRVPRRFDHLRKSSPCRGEHR